MLVHVQVLKRTLFIYMYLLPVVVTLPGIRSWLLACTVNPLLGWRLDGVKVAVLLIASGLTVHALSLSIISCLIHFPPILGYHICG